MNSPSTDFQQLSKERILFFDYIFFHKKNIFRDIVTVKCNFYVPVVETTSQYIFYATIVYL